MTGLGTESGWDQAGETRDFRFQRRKTYAEEVRHDAACLGRNEALSLTKENGRDHTRAR
jgi:hypothetical protein